MPPRLPKNYKADPALSDHFDFPVFTKTTSKGTARHCALVRVPSKLAISTFVDSLSHPDGPQHYVVFQELRLASPEIFTAMLRFLTDKRSSQVMSALETKLARCSCPKDDGTWDHSLSHSDASLRRLISRMSSLLIKALLPFAIEGVTWPSLERILKDAKKAAKRGERTP
ncbi:hypothetical protein CPB85DRAFT_1431736 [Mucidula mucida]|nr:hypothetical protein CPB85DRAFT_1431736 [Mucidula mucida]